MHGMQAACSYTIFTIDRESEMFIITQFSIKSLNTRSKSYAINIY